MQEGVCAAGKADDHNAALQSNDISMSVMAQKARTCDIA
jgi:hypothetical protein